jgi:hypothetical protein
MFVAKCSKILGIYATRQYALLSALADNGMTGSVGSTRRTCSCCASTIRRRADALPSHKDFHDAHRRTTMRADEGGLHEFNDSVSTAQFSIRYDMQQVRVPAPDSPCARYWRSTHNDGCGESPQAARATGSGV